MELYGRFSVSEKRRNDREKEIGMECGRTPSSRTGRTGKVILIEIRNVGIALFNYLTGQYVTFQYPGNDREVARGTMSAREEVSGR